MWSGLPASKEFSNSLIAVSYRKVLERKVRFKEDKISGSQLILTDVMSLFGDSDSEGSSDEDMCEVPSKTKDLQPPKLVSSKEVSSNSAASSGSSPMKYPAASSGSSSMKRNIPNRSPKKPPINVVKNFTNLVSTERKKRNNSKVKSD